MPKEKLGYYAFSVRIVMIAAHATEAEIALRSQLFQMLGSERAKEKSCVFIYDSIQLLPATDGK